MAASLLVLTDFFPAANRALDYAANLAGALHAGLILLHVRRTSLLDAEGFSGAVSGQTQESARVALSRLAEGLSVPAVIEVRQGRVAEVVAQAIKQHQPDLLVLGRPDTEAQPEESVSTASLAILQASPYAMLVLPTHVPHGARPRRLLIALDGEPFHLGQGNQLLAQLFKALHAQLILLHISTHMETAASALDSFTQTGLSANLPPVQSLLLRHSSPAEGILQAADPAQYDIVVLIARPRSILGKLFHRSVTAQVLLQSRLPVLVVPAAG
ncbi:universal stress protein [Hymenobacter sp. BT730]|uniref:universal stress protein n=1 Tax=Hymenobacter sp. BT730 TaxID=3063332 RepID=UPI0026E08435|nr:universal stress protein [Hymenobacter sp. BT730]